MSAVACSRFFPCVQRPNSGLLRLVHIHEHETRRIPDLVGEFSVAVGAAFVECNVSTRRGHGGQGEARGIGSEPLDDVQWIDHIPLGLRHLLPLGVTHQRVNVDLAKGNTVVLLIAPATGLFDLRILLMTFHEVAAGHDHARHPQEQNFVGRHQQCARIENFLIASLFGPAQRGKGQESG